MHAKQKWVEFKRYVFLCIALLFFLLPLSVGVSWLMAFSVSFLMPLTAEGFTTAIRCGVASAYFVAGYSMMKDLRHQYGVYQTAVRMDEKKLADLLEEKEQAKVKRPGKSVR